MNLYQIKPQTWLNYDKLKVYAKQQTPLSRSVCELDKISDKNGRFLLVHITVNNMEPVLVNVYAPTGDKIKEQVVFLNYVQNILVNFMDKTMIIGGDWNLECIWTLKKTNWVE